MNHTLKQRRALHASRAEASAAVNSYRRAADPVASRRLAALVLFWIDVAAIAILVWRIA